MNSTNQVADDIKEGLRKLTEHNLRQDEALERIIGNLERITVAFDNLAESTKDAVDLTRDLKAATRIGSAIQNFLLWLMKWGVIGVGLTKVIKWALTHLVDFF